MIAAPPARVTVEYTITTSGSRRGAEASQVYLTLPIEAGQPSNLTTTAS